MKRCVIVGQNAVSGWQRVELRELQTWTVWNDSITLTLNTGGLSAGSHDLYLCVIDGVRRRSEAHIYLTHLEPELMQASPEPLAPRRK